MVESCLKCGAQADLPDGHRLIVCASCGAVQSKVSATQPATPPSAPPPAKFNTRTKIVAAIATIGGLAGSIYATSGLLWGQPLASLTTQCQSEVKMQLKSPASAQFTPARHDGSPSKNNIKIIFGTVDSQNSFGAMLRSSYVCEVTGSALKTVMVM